MSQTLSSSSPAAATQNRVHDALRILPIELQSMCWSYLSVREICRLALVCTHWRDASASCPELWHLLPLDRIPDASSVQRIFARSGQLKIRLAVSVRTSGDWTRVPECLRVLAPRLCDLRMLLAFPVAELQTAGRTLDAFAFDAPVLENLSIDSHIDNGAALVLWEDTFNSCAPNLRSVDLYGVHLPDFCPAFGGVVSVWLGTSIVNMDALFNIFPSVKRLGFDNIISPRTVVPPVPWNVQLEEFMLIDDTHSPMSLRRLEILGYLRFPKVTLRSRMVWMLQMAAERGDEFSDTTLTISDHDCAQLSVGTGEQQTTHVCADTTDLRVLQHILDEDNIAHHLQHLVLPLYFPGTEPLLLQCISFPRLRSLAITCGEVSDSGPSHSLLDPTYSLGIIYAPLLARLELRRDAAYSDALEPVDPEHLAFFISERLLASYEPFGSARGDDGDSRTGEPEDQSQPNISDNDPDPTDTSQSLELRFDTANGVCLRDKTTLPVYLLQRDPSGGFSFSC